MKNKTLSFVGKVLPALCIFLGVLGWTISDSSAQSEVNVWSEPNNLSQSGAATEPVMVVDANGMIHVIWQDEFSGSVYTKGDGTQWSEPLQIVTPFKEFIPRLFADLQGNIHVFWINDKNALFYSKVKADSFSNPSAWTPPQRLNSSTLDYAVSIDPGGGLHLSYIRSLDSEESPAGVYYQQLPPGSRKWGPTIPLYQSLYMRLVTPEASNVQVDTSDGKNLYVVWDNRPRERIYLIESNDGGETWKAPQEIDKLDEGEVGSGPSNILVNVRGSDILLLWKAENTSSSCVEYYQISSDAGVTWQIPQKKAGNALGCPDDVRLMKGKDNLVLDLLRIKDQWYLQAWDGRSWSDLQPQRQLSGFIDPETNRPVILSCHQTTLKDGEYLYVVGCDTGLGKDVWWMKGQLYNIEDWFPKKGIWNPIIKFASGEQEFSFPVIIAESANLVHAFWTQSGNTVPASPSGNIYYARWDGQQWSQPIPVLSSPDGRITKLDVALNPKGRLGVVWSGGQSGEIYFSQVEADRMVIPSAWSKPEQLPSPQPSGTSPDILVDPNGTLNVIYAIPLNEGRGIYITRSKDGGQTWSEPVQIFDAEGAGWAMVDQPRLASTGSGGLYALWTRNSMPSGVGSMSLYYSYSNDGGISWSEAVSVADRPVMWSEIIGVGDQTIHRLWQEMSGGQNTLWHESSQDGGTTWGRTVPASTFGQIASTPSMTWDELGHLHLLQIVSTGVNSYVLQHWLWDGERWSTERSLDLNLETIDQIGPLVADVSADGNLDVIFSGSEESPGTGKRIDNLFFTDRLLELKQPTVTASPSSASSQPAQPTVIISSEPILTLTQVVATPTQSPFSSTSTADVSLLSQEPPSKSNSWISVIAAPVGVGIVVMTVILIGIRARGRRK